MSENKTEKPKVPAQPKEKKEHNVRPNVDIFKERGKKAESHLRLAFINVDKLVLGIKREQNPEQEEELREVFDALMAKIRATVEKAENKLNMTTEELF